MGLKEDTGKLLAGPTLIRPPRLRMLGQSCYLVPFYLAFCLTYFFIPFKVVLWLSCVLFLSGYIYVYLRVLRAWKLGHGSWLSLLLFNMLLFGLMLGSTLLLKRWTG